MPMNRNLPVALAAVACFAPSSVVARPAATLSATSVPALHGSASFHADAEMTQVAALEKRIWDAWKRRDKATIVALTDPSYVNVDENGVAGLADVLGSFAEFHLDDYQLGPMFALRIGPDAIVLNYNAKIHGHVRTGHVDVSRPVSESSLWVRRAGKWRNLMLHETTLAPIRFPLASPPNSRSTQER